MSVDCIAARPLPGNDLSANGLGVHPKLLAELGITPARSSSSRPARRGHGPTPQPLVAMTVQYTCCASAGCCGGSST